MIIFMLDMKGSTPALEKRGHSVTLAIRAQIEEITHSLFEGLGPPLDRFYGHRQGDGVTLGAPRVHSLELLERALTIRAEPPWKHPGWFPVRFVLGDAAVTWDGEPYGKDSVPNGRDIHILARLLADPEKGGACPAGSLVVNESLLRAVGEYANPLRNLFEQRRITFDGFEHPQTYGIVPALEYPRLLTAWKRFERSWAKPVILTLGAAAWSLVGRTLVSWIWP